MRGKIRTFVLALALACVLAFAGAPAAPAAWAEEGPDPSNQVNLQQLPDSSFIYDTSISELETADSYLDGQTVQVIGEVVGDRIHAELDPDHCWITLEATDGSFAEVPVLATTAATSVIDTYGAYGKRGTVLQVRGTFNLSCPDHAGLSDLHASHVSLVSKGSDMREAPDALQFVPGALLLAAGLALVLAFRRMRESRR
ncbi:hydrolase [Adlercreutzia sp. ZJ473]|uniref:hydrolase n=1 Tax=Adlercreutzia sp. ZJ473 TaxID=2722822 RepID=UPI001553BA03|nr:hydrolase [Adlercreutzia sp. ZJ473]